MLGSDLARQIVQIADGLILLDSLAGIDFRSFVTSANLDFSRVGDEKRYNQSLRGSQTNKALSENPEPVEQAAGVEARRKPR